MLKDLSLAVPPLAFIFRMHDDIGTLTWLCKDVPPFSIHMGFTCSLSPSYALLSPQGSISPDISLKGAVAGLCTEHFCSSIILVTEGFEMPLPKKSIYDQLTFSFMCCMSNHPSSLLLSRTTLLWGASHTGNQRNPSGKLVMVVLPSRRASQKRYGQRITRNHASTFQASPPGTLDLIVLYINNPFRYEIKQLCL